jgi:hypothetical protein
VRGSGWLPCLLAVAVLTSCDGVRARSDKSFDEISRLVSGKTAAQVAALLGEPDSRQSILSDSERWVWWSYTYLGGDQYAPEFRGRVVHLEITFVRSAARSTANRGGWRVGRPFGVSYSFPGKG